MTITDSQKIRFLKAFRILGLWAFNYPKASHQTEAGKSLIKAARKHLGYSQKTSGCDIWSALKIVWKRSGYAA